VSEGSFRITDLKSKNKTTVDGQRLKPFEPVPLRDDRVIEIVGHTLNFHQQAVQIDESNTGSTVPGTVDDLSSNILVSRSRSPTAAFRAVLDLDRALLGRRFPFHSLPRCPTPDRARFLGQTQHQLTSNLLAAKAACGRHRSPDRIQVVLDRHAWRADDWLDRQ
jgi:hypothetical protein